MLSCAAVTWDGQVLSVTEMSKNATVSLVKTVPSVSTYKTDGNVTAARGGLV